MVIAMARWFLGAFVATGMATVCLLASGSAARAGEVRCVGMLGNMSVNGDVVVPQGANCALRRLTVSGDVRAGQGSVLRILGGVAILGNLEIDQCAYASLDPSAPADPISIAGSVEIEHCTEASGKLFSPGRVAVAGNFSCRDNAAPCFAVAIVVGGDMLIDRNSGMSYVEGNTIGGNLECIDNWGVTDYGNPNTVGDEKREQCTRLSN